MSNGYMNNYGEAGVLDHFFRSSTLAKPSAVCFGLSRAVPNESQNGWTVDEVPNSDGYHRVNMGAPSNSLFSSTQQDGAGSGYIHNLVEISFPAVVTNSWGWVSGIFISDTATHGTGNIIYQGTLTFPQLMQPTSRIVISSGELRIYQR